MGATIGSLGVIASAFVSSLPMAYFTFGFLGGKSFIKPDQSTSSFLVKLKTCMTKKSMLLFLTRRRIAMLHVCNAGLQENSQLRFLLYDHKRFSLYATKLINILTSSYFFRVWSWPGLHSKYFDCWFLLHQVSTRCLRHSILWMWSWKASSSIYNAGKRCKNLNYASTPLYGHIYNQPINSVC